MVILSTDWLRISRFLHARVLLFRPMLARLCFPQAPASSCSSSNQCLGDRVLQDCASLCVENAEKIVGLIQEHCNPGTTIGVLPWWHRVFYLYISGVTFLAATLRPDLFATVVPQSWSKMMSVLRAHEHLGRFVEECVTAFQTLSCQISESHHPGDRSIPEGPSNTYFQDVFHDMGFDPDSLLFGVEDMSWLGN